MSPPRRTRRCACCAWPWCAWSDCRESETADARRESGERETPTMDTDTAMRWTRRSASRDADGCLWAGYGWTSENDSDKTSITFCARATLLQSSATGLPPASRIGRVEARHRCPPHPARSACATSIKRKERPCCACNGLVVKLSNDSPELRSLPPRKQRTLSIPARTCHRGAVSLNQ